MTPADLRAWQSAMGYTQARHFFGGGGLFCV